MICEAFLSKEKLMVSDEDLKTITDYTLRIYNSKTIEPEAVEKICALTRQDKKNEGGIKHVDNPPKR